MSLRVGQRVKGRASGTVGEIRARCPMHPHSWYVLPDGGCTTQCWPEDIFTPLPEPERAPGLCVWYDQCDARVRQGRGFCLTCGEYDPVDRRAYASRLSLIAYPELFICSKAGECKGKDGCFAGKLHDRTRFCERGDWCSTAHAHRHCIPYVPEDEADWFVARRASDAHGHGTKGLGGALLTKKGAELWVKDEPGYRAFKWSDGLKGTSCE